MLIQYGIGDAHKEPNKRRRNQTKNGENKNKTTIKTPNKNKRKIWGFTLIKRGRGLIRKNGSCSVGVITWDFESQNLGSNPGKS